VSLEKVAACEQLMFGLLLSLQPQSLLVFLLPEAGEIRFMRTAVRILASFVPFPLGCAEVTTGNEIPDAAKSGQ
jgi:hypothetical protein